MITSFQSEWDEAARSQPISEDWLEQLLAHKDEGPVGEPAARDLLREVMRLRQKLAAAEYLVRELDQHQGAEGWSDYLKVAIDEYKMEGTEPPAKVGNANLYTFRTTGKWYATGRATISDKIFNGMNRAAKRAMILVENGEKCPGLNSRGENFVWVVLLDDDVDYGFPLMLKPEGD